MGQDEEEPAGVQVGCVTTDFAMQASVILAQWNLFMLCLLHMFVLQTCSTLAATGLVLSGTWNEKGRGRESLS